VTGFGPFFGVSINPTMILVQRLEKELDTLASTMGIDVIKALILETSAEAVRKELDDIHQEICSDPNLAGCHVVFLHLGVNYMGKKFQLENSAYNDATFRVPDERGYQPHGICILEGSTCSKSTKSKGVHQFGKSLRTTLRLKEVCSMLEMESNAQPVFISNDPGRFVCNYTYCMSLDKCLSSAENSQSDNETKYHSLFVHVPPFRVIPEDNQYVFVLEIMKKIQQQLIK
jgi:pyroglutamyl-peptidase